MQFVHRLPREYKTRGMAAYARLQEAEFESEQKHQYSAVKHQRFVGTGYFDAVQNVITSGTASITALAGSIQTEQFHDAWSTKPEQPQPAFAANPN